MKKSLKTLLMSMTVFALLVSQAYAGKKETPASIKGVTTVDADTVKGWLDNGEEMVILDPRKSGDYTQKGHLPTAISCPLDTDAELSDKVISKAAKDLANCDELKGVGKGDKIVAYCNGTTCWMSPKAVTALVKMGYTNVYWFREGMKVWNEKGYPVE